MTDVLVRGTRGLVLLLISAAVIGSAACYRFTATKVSSIDGKSGEYEGKTVTVYGTVKERIDLPHLQCYILDDGTGTIAVATTGPLPRVGEKVHTRGRVQTAFAIGRRRFTAVIEAPRPAPTAVRQPPPSAVPPN